MSKLDTFYKIVSPYLLSLMRIVFALLFLLHGTQKLFQWPAAPGSDLVPGFYLASLPPLVATAGVLEFVGGVLLLIGLLVRPVAFLLSGQMAVAYFMAHAGDGLFPNVNGGEKAVLYCFAFFYLAAAGGGIWSLDQLLRRSKQAATPHKAESVV
ncbi:MAG: DoxX family protein [Armatimonadota bacterium]